MNGPKHQQTCLYIGSSSTPIIFAEIIPIGLVANENERYCSEPASQPSKQQIDQHQPFQFTNFGVKQFLLRETLEANAMAISDFTSASENKHQFFIRWKEDSDNHSSYALSSGYIFQNRRIRSEDVRGSNNVSIDDGKFPLVFIPSENPTIIDRQPCCIIAYAHRNHDLSASTGQEESILCHFSRDTLVRVLPPRLASKSRSQLTASAFSSIDFRRESMLYDLIGEDGGSKLTNEMIDELLRNHNEETIQELTLKISAAMTSIKIGTTQDAFYNEKRQRKQMRKIEQSIRVFPRAHSPKELILPPENNSRIDTQSWPSLIVHSPNHADGKTLLVHAIAKQLECSSIHVIRPGALLAKYSIRADSALESQVHAILISAACRKEKVCIILDQLDMILPSRLSGRSNSGDAATPILNSIASYLRKLTDSIQRKREIPFPLKNPLYNPVGSDGGSAGQVLNVKFCLVGIVTCPDDGWRSIQKGQSGNADSGSTILDCMIGDRYRLPILKARTILSAFDAAFASEGISLEESAKAKLALIASSAPWIKGSVFRRVAKQLKWTLIDESLRSNGRFLPRSEATIHDLEKALALVNPNEATLTKLEGQKETSPGVERKPASSHFGSIGGNEKAKISLEDALAFDPQKRKMLFRFGLSPPTGVLLYGPPGCGKTLLAKAIAKLFESPDSGPAHSRPTGGTFISLSISAVVSSEVGTSEKTIASSFEFAEKNAPSVIFLDEFQALFSDRNRGGSGKLTTTLLQCLDDVKRWYEIDESMNRDQTSPPEEVKRVVVIAATNTPWMIDSAFLRSGRFDRVVHVGLPSLSERNSILQVHVGKMRVRDGDNIHALNKLCEELSILTEGFSGADIAALCRAAAVRALGEETAVEGYHFRNALKCDVFPSSDGDLVKRLSLWRP